MSDEEARKNRSCFSLVTCGAAFQILGYMMFVAAVLAIEPMWAGLAFLEKIAPHFECKATTNSMTNSWKACTREQICKGGLDYRPVTTDEEYLVNWVQQLDLLCKP